ncbi:MAG: 2TM domain-containing protein [Ignavibacteria bacterium]|nr:2TM domain-containing protein [Ignavibacteria bacterium]
MNDRFYTKEELEKILQRVIESKGYVGEKFTRDDILNIAKDLNLDLNQVLIEIEKAEEVAEFERAKFLWKEKKKREFFQHLTVFILFNLLLTFISLSFSKGLLFVLLFAGFWGIGLAVDFFKSFFPTEEKVEKEASKILRSKKLKAKLTSFFDKLLDRFLGKS